MGSASELEYHIMLAHDLEYMDTPTHKQLITDVREVKRMLATFIIRLRTPKR